MMCDQQGQMPTIGNEPLMNEQDPPAEDSPRHILNILNNFCIQSIFEQIDDIEDYHNAANVCTLFQANAIKCFPAHLKRFEIDHSMDASEIVSILRLFGHQMHTVKLYSMPRQADGNEILNAIVTHCGKTLKNFEFRNAKLDLTNALPRFEALEVLALDAHVKLTHFEPHSPLKGITILSNNKDVPVNTWFTQRFPHLESIFFMLNRNLTDEIVIDMVNLNPQLRCLKMVNCGKLTTEIFNGIGHRVPNLEEFAFETWNTTVYFDENMRQLSNLTKLKNLTITASQVVTDELINLLVANQIPITALTIDGINDNLMNAAPIDGLTKLTINNVSDENLPHYIVKIPELKHLHITKTRGLTMNGLKKILEVGKKLKNVSLCVNNFDVDEQSYQSVLTLAKNRVNIRATVTTGTISVPSDVMKLNSKWFEMSLFSSCKRIRLSVPA